MSITSVCLGCAYEEACGHAEVRACTKRKPAKWCSCDPLRKAEAERDKWKHVAHVKQEMSELGNGKDYGIMPQPTEAQAVLDWLQEKVLGRNWYVAAPMNQQQANTCIAWSVLDKTCARTGCPLRRNEADSV